MTAGKNTGLNLAGRYGSWALVTGAAVGLGAEFARQIAAQKINLVLVDIDQDNLENTASQIRTGLQVEVIALALDLARDDLLEELDSQLAGREIALLVNNAGIPRLGEFELQSPAFLLQQMKVNMQAVMLLTHYFGTRMLARGKGGIIILSSMAAMNGGALNAHYSATKAYDLVLAESLWAEWKNKGIDVLGFMPWKTATPGYYKEATNSKEKDVMSVEQTVAQALAQLGKTPSCSVGNNARIAMFFSRLLSRRKMIEIGSSHLRRMLNKAP